MASPLDGFPVCRLITTGRVTAKPHRIDIWFAHRGDTVYMLSGGRDRSDWVRNPIHDPSVTVSVGTTRFASRARLVSNPDEQRLARDLVYAKYSVTYCGDLVDWRESALPVAVDLREGQ